MAAVRTEVSLVGGTATPSPEPPSMLMMAIRERTCWPDVLGAEVVVSLELLAMAIVTALFTPLGDSVAPELRPGCGAVSPPWLPPRLATPGKSSAS